MVVMKRMLRMGTGLVGASNNLVVCVFFLIFRRVIGCSTVEVAFAFE